jgi:hypothetical protein
MSKIIKLELFNPETGKNEVYRKVGANGKDTFEAFKLLDQLEDTDKYSQVLQKMLDYTVSLFAKEKLTQDAILVGVDSDKLFDSLNGVLDQVVGNSDDKSSDNPKK